MSDSELAYLVIGLQCVLIGVLLVAIRRWGALTEAVRAEHRSNMAVIMEIRKIGRIPLPNVPSQEKSA